VSLCPGGKEKVRNKKYIRKKNKKVAKTVDGENFFI
jgi:hypothetical protein